MARETTSCWSRTRWRPNDWSPDGRFILYVIAGSKGDRDIMALPLEGDRKPVSVVATPFNTRTGSSRRTGNGSPFSRTNPAGPRSTSSAFGGQGRRCGSPPREAFKRDGVRDGKELFYLAPDQRLMAVSIQLDAQRNVVDVGTDSRVAICRESRQRIAFAIDVVPGQRHASMETVARSEPLIIFHAPCVSPPATTMLISDGSKILITSSGLALKRDAYGSTPATARGRIRY